jgi:hypothetical protein
MVLKEIPERKGFRVKLVYRENRESRVKRVIKEIKVPKVFRESKDCLANQENRVRRANKGLKVILAKKGIRETKETPVILAHR